MTTEIDELIFRALDGKASAEELGFLSEWMKEEEHKSRFLQLKKLWNITSGPHITPEKKARELQRYLNSIRRKKVVRTWYIVWGKYAAVLLLPVIILLAVFKFYTREEIHPVISDSIHPGISKAMLTLANGETVTLPVDNPEDILLKDAVKVKSGGHGIVYENPGKDGELFSYNTLTVPRGGEYSVVLSDGTIVYLNSESRLHYPVVFSSDQRIVDVEGEGYFEVAHDPEHPFIVRVDGIEIKVYGTVFNINTYEAGKVQTTLVEGCVGLRIPDTGEEVVLGPADMACYDRKSRTVEVGQVDPFFYTAWKNGKFVFENETIEKIMQRLERWYDIDVAFENEQVKKCAFTGIITRYAEIGVVLNLLQETTLVNFEIRGNTVVVK